MILPCHTEVLYEQPVFNDDFKPVAEEVLIAAAVQ